ncbi:AAA family ATPase [Amnibacterium sp.]|uniref:AAA family ATPase n=1 Tax=Amnibacterium sp. TaxID=1872496 RepID=UPI003F7C1D00
MRIERLTVEGFGPFAAEQSIDFAPLDEAGLFLITGRTGSGKSSILDAICFALYGTAPRYDGAQARLRSDHAPVGSPTRVTLEFAVGGERWRVVRSPEYDRPKQRGSGTTREPQSATLERWDGAGWIGVAARPVDVAEHLGPVLQLTREQFLQVILLAQGRFQEFLKAKTDERLGLLRALFGTERFQRFEAEVSERAKALEQQVAAGAAAVRADAARLAALVEEDVPEEPEPSWAASIVERLRTAAAAAEAEAETARTAFEAADRAAADAAAVAERQRRRRAAREALAALEAQRDEVEAARGRIGEAVRVLPLIPAVDAAERAAHERAAAVRARETARAVPGADVPDPLAAVAELDERLGALADRLRDEEELPRLAAAAERAAAARTAAEQALLRVAEEAQTLPDRRAALQERLRAAESAAEGADAAAAELERARAVARAVEAARHAADAAAAAGRGLEAALADEEQAVGRTRALVAARLAGAAGLLAAALTPDDPCPVCGSVDHPAPAERDVATPDDAAVGEAEAAQQAAADRRAAAHAQVAETRAARAAATAAADGATAEAAERAIATAQERLDVARRAAADRGSAARELEALETRAAELDRAGADARTALDARAADSAGAKAAADAAGARVVAARGDAVSISALVTALRSARLALGRGPPAAARHGAGAGADSDARARLAAALAEAGVPDARLAREAALTAADRAALEERVRAWEAARHGATAQLADPGVAGAPEEPADVAGAIEAKAVALQRRDERAEALITARSRVDVAAALAGSITTAVAGTADERARLQVVGPLAEVVRGGGSNALRMRLESYVLAARLEQIVAAANVRLSAMTDGRFTLQHDDTVAYRGARSGLGLEVLDEHTGRPRPVASLSGGETFLASLALALGLAEVVSAEAGGVRLDTLFVDEGFGSLDRRTLDTAMETLDSLRAGGRTVGLISHVEAMQEDIPAGLHVERRADGSSAIRSRIPAVR